MDAMLIVNPSSGSEKAEEYRERIVSELSKRYNNVYVRLTTQQGDATNFAIEAANKELSAVFSMGGDGTVNEVAAGLAQSEYQPLYGIIPLGTVNDVARALHIPLTIDAYLEQLDAMVMHQLDVGQVNDQYFINVVAVGELPNAVQNVPVKDKTKFGSLAYVFHGLKSFLKRKRKNYVVELDGETLILKTEILLFLLTNSVGGVGFIAPNARIDDGYMHCVALTAKNFAETMSVLGKIMSGDVTDAQHVFYRRFKHAYISQVQDDDVSCNVDGDEGPRLPLELTIIPKKLRVLAPASVPSEEAGS